MVLLCMAASLRAGPEVSGVKNVQLDRCALLVVFGSAMLVGDPRRLKISPQRQLTETQLSWASWRKDRMAVAAAGEPVGEEGVKKASCESGNVAARRGCKCGGVRGVGWWRWEDGGWRM